MSVSLGCLFLCQSLDSQAALQSWVDVIERDLDRQFPFHEMFLSKDGHGYKTLQSCNLFSLQHTSASLLLFLCLQQN